MGKLTAKRDRLLASIAGTISDYRAGELAKPTPDHVDRWVKQFAPDVQVPLLQEVDHVLRNTYFSRKLVSKFLDQLVRSEKLTGKDPRNSWKKTNFLRVQQNGNSQVEMLGLFEESLQSQCGLRIEDCGSEGGPYLYLDDVIFSGSRVGTDLSAWLAKNAPANAEIHILCVATHSFGEYKSIQRIKADAVAAGKKIALNVWRVVSFENRNDRRDSSEVLWPAVLPDKEELHAYMAEEKRFPFHSRQPGNKLEHNVFSSEEGRQLLEREFLLAGLRIRSLSQNPSRALRPLGFSPFGLGFGSMIVTFRNCPNNSPLALWWGAPEAPASSPLSKWYPLLQRKPYT